MVSITKLRPGQGIHPAQTGGLLSGAHIQKGAIIRSGVSVDQVLPIMSARIPLAKPRVGLQAADDGLPRVELFAGLPLA